MRATKTDVHTFQEQFRLLEIHASHFPPAEIARITQDFPDPDPLRILTSTLLSARTRDSCTRLASERLFALAPDLASLARLDVETISTAIKGVGFPAQKARQLLELFRILVRDFDSRVPKEYDKLVSLPGTGPKTAALVQAAAFGIPSICVDVHVLRIAGRLGWASLRPWTTKTMLETRKTLESIFPLDAWNRLNPVLVVHGQNCCRPVNPACGLCPLGSGINPPGLACPFSSAVDHPQ